MDNDVGWLGEASGLEEDEPRVVRVLVGVDNLKQIGRVHGLGGLSIYRYMYTEGWLWTP